MKNKKLYFLLLVLLFNTEFTTEQKKNSLMKPIAISASVAALLTGIVYKSGLFRPKKVSNQNDMDNKIKKNEDEEVAITKKVPVEFIKKDDASSTSKTSSASTSTVPLPSSSLIEEYNALQKGSFDHLENKYIPEEEFFSYVFGMTEQEFLQEYQKAQAVYDVKDHKLITKIGNDNDTTIYICIFRLNLKKKDHRFNIIIKTKKKKKSIFHLDVTTVNL